MLTQWTTGLCHFQVVSPAPIWNAHGSSGQFPEVTPPVQYSDVSVNELAHNGQWDMAAHVNGDNEPTSNQDQYINTFQPGGHGPINSADLLPPGPGPFNFFQQIPVTSTYYGHSADTAGTSSIGGSVVGAPTEDPTGHFWVPEVQPLVQ